METVKEKLFGLYPNFVCGKKIVLGNNEEYGLFILSLRSIDDLTEEEDKIKRHTETWYNETDYLRSIGIALPFGYMENNEFKVMSVEEQVANGFVVLKEWK
jgi:hypothetical protein